MTETTLDKPSGAEAAKDRVEEVKGQAQEKVQEASGHARDRVREQVDQRSTQAGEQVSSAARDARSVGEELRRQGKEQPAKLADQAADRAERLGSYLQESDADRILRDVEDLGRRQPWLVVAGGLALGFMASRFLKASSEQRYRSTSIERRYPTNSASPERGL
jgi:vacuolar-type H+-ATPase subunit H